ncbi:MAG: universal stress protein [Nitriliruptor sp.]|nr:MAG: universal stress protein [Nitriliruptor sp.]
MPKCLLVGVDGSDSGRRALEFARGRAEDLGATLVLAHVIPWSPYSFNTPEENEQRHARRKAELAAAEEQILGPARELAGDKVEVVTLAKHGDRAETLNDLAEEHGADHIIVGRTGESRLRSKFFGSVPSELTMIADVPVTVVP